LHKYFQVSQQEKHFFGAKIFFKSSNIYKYYTIKISKIRDFIFEEFLKYVIFQTLNFFEVFEVLFFLRLLFSIKILDTKRESLLLHQRVLLDFDQEKALLLPREVLRVKKKFFLVVMRFYIQDFLNYQEFFE